MNSYKTNYLKVKEFTQAMGQPVNIPTSDSRLISQYALRKVLILEEAAEAMGAFDAILRSGPTKDNVAHLTKELADILYVVYGAAVTFGLPLEEVFNRVHISNMSKLVDGKPLKRDDGKVLKGPNYQPPQLDDLFNG